MGGRGASAGSNSRLSNVEKLRKERTKKLNQERKGYPTEEQVRTALNKLGEREMAKVGNLEIRNYGSFYNVKVAGDYGNGYDMETKSGVLRILREANKLKK